MAPTSTDGIDPIAYTRTIVGHASFHAQNQGRTDLVERLEAIRASVEDGLMTIAVVAGLTDSGKTTLVNECLGQDLLPVDLLRPTAIPTWVCAGDGSATVHGGSPQVPSQRHLHDANELRTAVFGAANDACLARVTSTVWPRPTGLALLDTPSWSLANSLQRNGIFASNPNLVILVSDAGQELSDAELTVLSMAQRRGMPAAVVLTKTDLHPHWQRIKAIDQQHLANAGLRVPVLPVGLRLAELGRTTRRPELIAESGLASVLAFLDQAATGQRYVDACSFALDVVTEVGADLVTSLRAQASLAAAEAAPGAQEARASLEQRVRQMQVTNGTWRQELDRRYQILRETHQSEVAVALRRVQAAASAELDSEAPKEIWQVFAPRFIADSEREIQRVFNAVERDVRALDTEMSQLLGVKGNFQAVSLGLVSTASRLDEDELLDADDRFAGSPSTRVIGAFRGALPGSSVTAMALHSAPLSAAVVGAVGISAAAVLLPLGAALTVALGRHTYQSVRKAEIESQRREAKVILHKYTEAFISVASKPFSLRLTSIRNELMDWYADVTQTMAQQVQAEARVTLLNEAEREAKVKEITQTTKVIEDVLAHVPRVRQLLGATRVT